MRRRGEKIKVGEDCKLDPEHKSCEALGSAVWGLDSHVNYCFHNNCRGTTRDGGKCQDKESLQYSPFAPNALVLF